jgi:macrolide transport system ATP-binding/permease protein
MRFVNVVGMRLRSVLRRRQVEDELDEELRYHLEREVDENIAAGMSPEEARFAALRTIGGLTQRREECRDRRGLNVIDNILNDVRFAVRQLRKDLGFTTTAVLMLALGVCSAIAIFAFVDAALVKPLPYMNPQQLLGVYEKIEPWCVLCNLSWPDYLDWKRQNTTLASLDVYQGRGYAMTAAAGSVPVHGARVSDGFFRTLGVTPILGRDFYPGEDQPGLARTVILSYGAWQKQFAGRASVLGESVVLDRIPRVIVGVLPRDFHFGPAGQADYWAPFYPETECDLRRSCHSIYGVGRLKAGISVDAALANVTSIARALEQQHPDTNRNQGANVVPLSGVIVGTVRPILLVLMAGAALLLLIAAVDVTGLMLVRAESRRREVALRAALGASLGRLVSQFTIEAMVLVAAGAGLGMLASHWTMKLLTALLSEDMLAQMPFLSRLGWNWRVEAFALAISTGAAALFAVAPNLRLWSSGIRAGISEGARGSAAVVWRRLGSKLVVFEIATAMVLLVGAGLLGRSLYNLLRVNLGLEPEHLVTLEVAPPNATYGNDAKAIALARKLTDRVAQVPGVRMVGFSANGIPLSHNGNTNWIRILGRPWNGEHIDIPERDVSANYFRTLGAKLAQGRYFSDDDDASRPGVAIVNQAFVRKHFPGENPIGRQIGPASAKPKPVEIVGVVEDVREGPLDAEIPPVLYRPYNQSPETYLNLLVRTDQVEASILPVLNRLVREIDPEIIPVRGKTMSSRVEESQSAYMHRSLAWLVGGFAGLALVLALVGLYGVVMYSVSQRTREIGIRMALGAESGSVYRMILREAMQLTAVGIAAGLIGGVLASRLIRGLLFGVSSSDPATMTAIAGVLALAAVAASLAPARRAALVNPVEALRAE